MILADTSIWIDHFRQTDTRLVLLLETGQVMCHPFIVGELALGTLKQRRVIIEYLTDLPSTTLASQEEVMDFIEKQRVFGQGIGYVDAHLLASARLSSVPLWTKDKRLHAVAATLGVALS